MDGSSKYLYRYLIIGRRGCMVRCRLCQGLTYGDRPVSMWQTVVLLQPETHTWLVGV